MYPGRNQALDWLRGFRAGSRPHPRHHPAVDHRIGFGIAHASGEAIPVEGGEGTDQVFQPRTGAAQDHGQVGLAATWVFQLDATVGQARGEAHRSNAIQKVHGRHVQGEPQSFGCADRTIERRIEIAGSIAAERLRGVDHQAFRMDQPIIKASP